METTTNERISTLEEQDSRPRSTSEDSADEEAFTCLDPFGHDCDEQALGLDDLA